MAEHVPIGLLIVLTIVSMLFSALLAASDEAVDRLTRARALEAVADGQKRASRLLWLAAHRAQVLVGVRAMAVVFHMIAAVCVTLIAASFLETWWATFLVTLLVTTVLIGLLVSSSPRALGRHQGMRVASYLSAPLKLLGQLSGWFSRWPEKHAHSEDALLEGREAEAEEEEFEDLVDRASESGQIEEDEREMLESVIELGRTLVREVMVPRTDMVTIKDSATLDTALSLFTRSGYSRVPVVGENVDDLRGILYLKDVLRRTHHRLDASQLRVADIMREAFFVPETLLADDLLTKLRRARVHIAIPVDEWGAIAGLVTIEDLLEELVGEMTDEHDPNEQAPQEVEPGLWRVPARLAVDELGDLLGLEVDDDDVDTAGGLLAKALGEVPILGSEADVQGLHIVAERVEGRRKQVSTLLVSRVQAEKETEEDAFSK